MTNPLNPEAARENLLYIRRTLEAAGQFTAVPGISLMAAGVVALAGVMANALITGAPWSQWPPPACSLDIWGVVLGVSLAIVSFGIYRKAEQMRSPIQAALIRRLLWSLCPAFFVGGLLTSLAVRGHNLEWLPTIWLGCYGAAIVNGGQVSVPPVRYMGLSFLAVSAWAALSSPALGLVWLGMGFGWLHMVYGAYIAWRHNG
jgi:hypothetical protein